jgi:hypothetical protein
MRERILRPSTTRYSSKSQLLLQSLLFACIPAAAGAPNFANIASAAAISKGSAVPAVVGVS